MRPYNSSVVTMGKVGHRWHQLRVYSDRALYQRSSKNWMVQVGPRLSKDIIDTIALKVDGNESDRE